ncbi:uncharacterized protein FIBRA_07592 [Fibroporia radiculosa]|uniref:Uncharacterized protein n=1 Tax=Fibroporia radiculosa TaxID=599839 RepID=J4IBW6_9APHY|nr:uncharacterized protein FIBRA_07592 [Fibroporia radiculosa]CCM05376.1 predicted protein [Fibroporia radiculosa]
MPRPSEFSLRLQHGITGGFAPPTASAIYTITASPSQPMLQIGTAIRPDGTPSLQDASIKSLSSSDESVNTLLEELHTILQSLPTEYPPGSEDIYGMDTSIAYGSKDLTWMNGGPQGCGTGQSERKATEAERAKFGRAVSIVNELVEKAS